MEISQTIHRPINSTDGKITRLHVVYIRPTRYDDEGYVRRFLRAPMSSNTLAALETLTRAVGDSRELGPNVQITVESFDDAVQRPPVKRIARLARRPGTRVVVGLAGVQTNEFARAGDLALEFVALGIPAMIGGFHVSGTLAMFDKPTPDLQQLLDGRVTLVRGEIEGPGVLEGILRDALEGRLKRIYDIRELPSLTDVPAPNPVQRLIKKYVGRGVGVIDTSRGCPFNCSFCSIITVQGRRMRCRPVEFVLRSIEEHYAQGRRVFFFSDDNFPRNPLWEELFDGLIALRGRGICVSFLFQTDMQTDRIPRFVEKAAQAGCCMVCMGVESTNQENLKSVSKHQNRVADYAATVEAWHKHNVLVLGLCIVGMTSDTPESIRRDVEVLQHAVKVDFASFMYMTALPGSEDQRDMVTAGVLVNADPNEYDGLHVTFRHPHMTHEEWITSYRDVTNTFYSIDNIIESLCRICPDHREYMFWSFFLYRMCAVEGTHPNASGIYRLKDRCSRRPVFPRESILEYSFRRMKDAVCGLRRWTGRLIEFQEVWTLARRLNEPSRACAAEMRASWHQACRAVKASDLQGDKQKTQDTIVQALMECAKLMRWAMDQLVGPSPSYRANQQRCIDDAEQYARRLQQGGSATTVGEAMKTGDELVRRYEEVAIPGIALRRRLNCYRRSVLHGRGFQTADLWKAPCAVVVEIILLSQFLIAVLLHPPMFYPQGQRGLLD